MVPGTIVLSAWWRLGAYRIGGREGEVSEHDHIGAAEGDSDAIGGHIRTGPNALAAVERVEQPVVDDVHPVAPVPDDPVRLHDTRKVFSMRPCAQFDSTAAEW